MARTFSLLALLALGPMVFAGPPAPPSGEMVFDPVADWVLRCREEKDAGTRLLLLKRLPSKRDPRVKAALHHARQDPARAVAAAAEDLLSRHYGWVPVYEGGVD